jgi:hypothetical protein
MMSHVTKAAVDAREAHSKARREENSANDAYFMAFMEAEQAIKQPKSKPVRTTV